MSSGFITESEAAEARKLRQEQWEKVRTATEPLEAPEEPFDGRSLYHRLEEQKNKKDAEFEEAHKLKNMIRGLDDDEVGFLEMVEQSKASVARQISLEEQREMREFRERVISVQDTMEKERLNQIKQQPPKRTNANSTRNMLQGVIVKKRKVSDSDNKTEQSAETSSSSNGNNSNHSNNEAKEDSKTNEKTVETTDNADSNTIGALKCIGVLPGIGPYRDSSDSDCSSDSDDEEHNHTEYDLLGRKIEKDKEEQH